MTINILIIGAICAVAVLIVPGFLGRGKGKMLSQYGVLEKRFRLKRHAFASKWGSGIGERYSLSGEYRGYPIAIYDHFRGSGRKKRIWTSLTMEATFAGEREFLIESPLTEDEARFNGGAKDLILCGEAGPFRIRCSDDNSDAGLAGALGTERLAAFEGPGAFRLSKGFFEYREKGRLVDESMRLRFQEALLILAEMADRVSEYNGSLES